MQFTDMDEKITGKVTRVFFKNGNIMPSQPYPINPTRIGTLRWLLQDESFKAVFPNLQMILRKLNPTKLRCYLNDTDSPTKIDIQTVSAGMLRSLSLELQNTQRDYANQLKTIVSLEDKIIGLRSEIRALKNS